MEVVWLGGVRVKQLVRVRVRRRSVRRVRRGHVVWWRRGHGLERVLRLFGRVSVLVLVLVLVVVLVGRRGRRGLDRRDVVRVVAGVLLLAREPLAEHRLASCTLRGVLVVRWRQILRRRHGLRRGGHATARTENAATAGKDHKVILNFFLLDDRCGAVGLPGWRRVAHGRQGLVRLLPHAIQDDLFSNEQCRSELIDRVGMGDTYESFGGPTIGFGDPLY